METLPEIYSSHPRFSIKQIFKKHWPDFLSKHRASLPGFVISNVQKMLSCRDPDNLGYHKFACPNHPDQYIIVPHSCKTRFCSPCGKISTDHFISKLNSYFPSTNFHHICFTIPEPLRVLLDENKFLLHALFKASSQTVLSYAKERHFLPAILSALHTFGQSLKFHSHIHMLVSSGGLDLKSKRENKWKSCKFFPFNMLRKRFPPLCLNLLKKDISSYLKNNPDSNSAISVFSNKAVLNAFFEDLYSINWYVHDSTDLPHEDFTVAYIARYAKKPPIAASRILFYGFNSSFNSDVVTYSYKERTAAPVKSTIPVEAFISLLVKHILPPNFRAVRCYGLISNRNKKRYKKILSKHARKTPEDLKIHCWRERQTKLRGCDPLICPICKSQMVLVEIAYANKSEISDSLTVVRFPRPP